MVWSGVEWWSDWTVRRPVVATGPDWNCVASYKCFQFITDLRFFCRWFYNLVIRSFRFVSVWFSFGAVWKFHFVLNVGKAQQSRKKNKIGSLEVYRLFMLGGWVWWCQDAAGYQWQNLEREKKSKIIQICSRRKRNAIHRIRKNVKCKEGNHL